MEDKKDDSSTRSRKALVQATQCDRKPERKRSLERSLYNIGNIVNIL